MLCYVNLIKYNYLNQKIIINEDKYNEKYLIILSNVNNIN